MNVPQIVKIQSFFGSEFAKKQTPFCVGKNSNIEGSCVILSDMKIEKYDGISQIVHVIFNLFCNTNKLEDYINISEVVNNVCLVEGLKIFKSALNDYLQVKTNEGTEFPYFELKYSFFTN